VEKIEQQDFSIQDQRQTELFTHSPTHQGLYQQDKDYTCEKCGRKTSKVYRRKFDKQYVCARCFWPELKKEDN